MKGMYRLMLLSIKLLNCSVFAGVCETRRSASEAFYIIREAFNDEAMSKTSIFRWHKTFKEGRENVEDIEHDGDLQRPSQRQ
ncbi:hypothetical protein TNCT_659041 [Trichonephila clavata]|uniref:Mos1 transposase HTH domain-containing protein n=1 Tax=Trichonephila clavata TaxID=2740835 RepID=A0A8X6F9C4_TRICU|nr:hypothetical protein TNCT_659041 [Trichonephila clavata]